MLLQDGVDISGLGGALTSFDTAQIDVLRGPQGAIMGAGALAGLIHIETQSPTDTADLNIAMGLENYGGSRLGCRCYRHRGEYCLSNHLIHSADGPISAMNQMVG